MFSTEVIGAAWRHTLWCIVTPCVLNFIRLILRLWSGCPKWALPPNNLKIDNIIITQELVLCFAYVHTHCYGWAGRTWVTPARGVTPGVGTRQEREGLKSRAQCACMEWSGNVLLQCWRSLSRTICPTYPAGCPLVSSAVIVDTLAAGLCPNQLHVYSSIKVQNEVSCRLLLCANVSSNKTGGGAWEGDLPALRSR